MSADDWCKCPFGCYDKNNDTHNVVRIDGLYEFDLTTECTIIPYLRGECNICGRIFKVKK